MAKSRRTLDQERACFAWGAAETGMRKHPKEYRPLAKSASALVMGSGLMPTLAFLKGKKGEAHAALLASLCAWLSQRGIPDREKAKGDEYTSLMDHLHEKGSQDYIQATHEALAILKWIRQYVDAVPSAARDRS